MNQLCLNHAFIQKALDSKKNIGIIFALVMGKFPGNQKAKLKSLERQIIKYFQDNAKINIQEDYFAPRLEPNQSHTFTKPVSTALIVHGADFLDDTQISSMFSRSFNNSYENRVKKITWINESNFLIVFVDLEQTLRALQQMTCALTHQEARIQEEVEQGQPPRGWFQLNTYGHYGIQRKLFARYATNFEIGIKAISHRIRYTFYQIVQRGLQLHLLTKFEAVEDFQGVLRQIQYDNTVKSLAGLLKQFKNVKLNSQQREQGTNKKKFIRKNRWGHKNRNQNTRFEKKQGNNRNYRHLRGRQNQRKKYQRKALQRPASRQVIQ